MSDDLTSVAIERRGGACELRLHTGGGPFLWTATAALELGQAFGQIARDPDVRVVVLYGTGRAFCELGKSLDPLPVMDARDWEAIRWHGEQLLTHLLAIQAPIIACINGPVTAHPEIPLLCDIVLAAEHAVIQDGGHFIFNVAPGDGLHIAMPLLMGLTRARYFLMTGQKIDAPEALRLGLVNEVLPAEALLPRARELAAELLARNPLALRYTRLMLTHHLKTLFHAYLGYGGALEGLAVIDQGAQQVRK